MKYLLLSFLSALFFSCGNNEISLAEDKQDRTASSLSQAQLNLVFENSKVFPENTQIAIAFISDGNTTFYGIKRENGTIITFDNSASVFEIGSISKVFTATLLAHFVVESKVYLNEPINPYWESTFKGNQKLPFKSLANHTSGLPRLPSNLNLLTADQNNPYKEYDVQKLTDFLVEDLDLANETEHPYAYSNLGAGLLGHTLAKIDDTSYQLLLQDHITDRFDMKHTTTIRNTVENRLIKGQDPVGNPVPNWDLNVLAGAGGILSSVSDLSKFALAQLDSLNIDLKLTRKKTASVNENMDIGLGWHIIKNENKNDWVWHNGGTGGYTSSMTVDVSAKNAVIILSNVSAFSDSMGNMDALGFGLMRTLDSKE